jgi:hypothetical protein
VISGEVGMGEGGGEADMRGGVDRFGEAEAGVYRPDRRLDGIGSPSFTCPTCQLILWDTDHGLTALGNKNLSCSIEIAFFDEKEIAKIGRLVQN